jgi:predicted ribosome-associated RNA-binding protein Tma20
MWFKRPPKVKPYAQLKGSEVKRLQALIVKQYGITAESADLWLPRNASIQHARFTISDPITGAQELDGVLYAIRLSASSSTMEPLAFQVENVVYPTIYALYKVPCVNLGMPVLQTTAHVLERMADRADLMLPGLKLNDDDEEFPLPAFRENDLIAVSVIGAG